MENKKIRASGHTKWLGGAGLTAVLPRAAELFGNPTFTLVVTLILQFSAALLLAQGKFLGRFAPFGAAFVAAAAAYPYAGRPLRRWMPCAALAGAVAGYLLAGGAIDGMKYCAASILCCAAGLIFRGTAFPGQLWFTPAVAGGSLVLTNLVYLLAASPGPGELLLFGCEAAMTACAAFFYIPVLDALHGPREEKREKPPNRSGSVLRPAVSRRAAVLVSGVSLVLVLADFTPFFGMSAGRMAALFLTLSLAAAAGPLYGCAAGLISGLAIDLTVSGAPSVALVYAAAGLFAGAFRYRGAFWTVFCFTAAHAALMPWAWADAPLAVLYECFAMGVVWFLSSRSVTACAGRLLALPAAQSRVQAPVRPVFAGAEQAALAKLRALTAAFETVGSAVRPREMPPQEDVPISSYDIAVERVCRNCRINNLCWNRDYQSTRNALNEAAEKIRSRGRANTQDFPPFFTARCENLGEFVANINENIALRESRSRYRRRAADDARLLGAQYDAMTQALAEISEELSADTGIAEQETRELRRALAAQGIAINADLVRTNGGYKCRLYTTAGIPRAMMESIEDTVSSVTGRNMRASGEEGETVVLREAEILRAVVGVGLKQRRGEDESGDSAAYFRTDDGKLYLILADGMGSGPDAARESAAFVRMMEGFLRAGVTVRTALGLLNPAFAVKCGGDAFTTCDILCVDLHTGEGECYKCGAAPTYVCSTAGKGVRRICSGSMPVGLPNEAPDADYSRLMLELGDIVVMVSDGLTENDSDAWLTTLLSDHRFTSAANLASAILDAGAERTGGRDDMTVLVLKLSAMRA